MSRRRLGPALLICALMSNSGCGDGADGAGAPDGGGGGAGGAAAPGPAPGGGAGPSGGGGVGSPAESPDVVQACGGYAGALCGRLEACSPSELQINYGDRATCAARQALGCREAAAATGSMVTAAMLGACTTQLGTAACDAFFYGTVAACAFKGVRDDGYGCASDWQCRSGLCRRVLDQNCGACAPPLPEGGTCADESDCAANLECSDSAVCKSPSGAGMPCSEAQPCRVGTYCQNGSCAEQVAQAGAACQEASACSGQKGLFCNTGARMCAAFKVARSGEACGAEAGGAICGASSECRPRDDRFVCSMVARDGETCGTEGASCLLPAACIAGTCRIPRGLDCN
jgi:hypothetical protein